MYQNVEYFCKTKLFWFMLIAQNIIAGMFSWHEVQVYCEVYDWKLEMYLRGHQAKYVRTEFYCFNIDFTQPV